MGYYQMTLALHFLLAPGLEQLFMKLWFSILWSGAFVFGLITSALMFFVKERQTNNS